MTVPSQPASRAVRGYSGLTLWPGLALDRRASILSGDVSLKTCASPARAAITGRLRAGTMPVAGKAVTDEIMSVGKLTPSPSGMTASGPTRLKERGISIKLGTCSIGGASDLEEETIGVCLLTRAAVSGLA